MQPAATIDDSGPRLTLPPRRPFSFLTIVAIAVVGLVLQAALLYFDAFRIAPSGDDGDLIAYIGEGRAHGFAWFFLHQKTSLYFRPAKHCIVWLLGLTVETHRDVAYRSLHFVAFAIYLLALTLWLRWSSLPRRATVVAIVVFLIHPALVATLSSIDGYGGIVATAMTWLGLLAAVRFVDRPAVAIPLVVVTFLVGCLFKEYVFALLPLAVIATYVFAANARWRKTLTLAAILGVTFAGYMVWRKFSMPTLADDGVGAVTRSPITLALNVVLAGVGAFYPGDTISIALHRSVPWIAALAVLTTLSFGLLCRGLWPAWRSEIFERRRLAFLLIAFAGSTFPCILHAQHFAEKYVATMLLPLALLAGIAAEGLMRDDRLLGRWVVSVLAALLACTSVAAVLYKNGQMRSLGERSTVMAARLADVVPDVQRDERVLLLFKQSQMAGQPRYSIYCMSDAMLLTPSNYALEWWYPRSKMTVQVLAVDSVNDLPAEKRAQFDRVLLWDAVSKTFTAV